MTPTLITIPTSHYCEKARWALDRAKVEYKEDAHAPLVSRIKVWGTVPVLVTDEGRLTDSTEIMRKVAPSLYHDDAEELEERFDTGLGEAARTVAFDAIAADRPLALRISVRGVPRWEAGVAKTLFGMAAGILRRRYRISPASIEAAFADLRREFAWVSQRLEGRRFLAGDSFSAADLTFAALSAPVLLPEGGKASLPTLDEAPAALAALARELRATPAGAFALRMFAEERGP